MLNRRKVLFAAALMAAALPAMPVMASDSRLLADILAGVSDALTRDYIRKHYQEGRWDGSHWNYGGRRYTAAEYGRYWSKVLVVQRQPLHARHLPPLLDRRLLQALSSACAPSAASGSQASARSGPPPGPPHFGRSLREDRARGRRSSAGGPGPRPSHGGGPRPPHFGGPGGRGPGGPGGPR